MDNVISEDVAANVWNAIDVGGCELKDCNNIETDESFSSR